MRALRVELFFDEEARDWHYRVPALRIHGRGTPARVDAERESRSGLTTARSSLRSLAGRTTTTSAPGDGNRVSCDAGSAAGGSGLASSGWTGGQVVLLRGQPGSA